MNGLKILQPSKDHWKQGHLFQNLFKDSDDCENSLRVLVTLKNLKIAIFFHMRVLNSKKIYLKCFRRTNKILETYFLSMEKL